MDQDSGSRSNELAEQIVEARRAWCAEAKVPPELADPSHLGQFATMYRLILLEQAILSRFPAKPPHGLVKAIVSIACDELDLVESSVARLRQWISKCRRGLRHTIPRLQSRR